jgi:hypothetical protein
MTKAVYKTANMANDLMASEANHIMDSTSSCIAPAKQAWIPIIRSIKSSINSAQPSVQANWHMPLKVGKFFIKANYKLANIPSGIANAAQQGIIMKKLGVLDHIQ